MDIGKDVRRKKTDVVARKLAATVPDLIQGWTADNFHAYVETMELIREGAPVQWVKLYHEAVKMGLERNTNINININRQQDRENLQALVRTRIPLTNNGAYTPYEEVIPEKIPVKRDAERQ
jgi:hypothetical protein